MILKEDQSLTEVQEGKKLGFILASTYLRLLSLSEGNEEKKPNHHICNCCYGTYPFY